MREIAPSGLKGKAINDLSVVFPIEYTDWNGIRRVFYAFPEAPCTQFGKRRRQFLIRISPSGTGPSSERFFQFDLEEENGGWWRVEWIGQTSNYQEFEKCGLPDELILSVAKRYSLLICSSTFDEMQLPKAKKIWKRLQKRLNETADDFCVKESGGRFWLARISNECETVPGQLGNETTHSGTGILGVCETVIANFCECPSIHTAKPLIDFFRTIDEPEAVAELARALANSGRRLDLAGNVGDIASTGGPSSLSTLLCPLFLVASGFIVPKLGVQGRPAGGIDVMAQIPSFDISPDPDKLRGIIQQCRFAHFLADETYAPLDQALFRFRQELNAQAVRNLVVASILAKKLAVGITTVGLEIRVFAGGNFGGDVQEAVENAHFFVKVAKFLKIRATGFLTDCTVPYQPFVGRGEAIMALHDLFYGKPSSWLESHALQCLGFVRRMGRTKDGPSNLSESLRQARSVFEQHLEAQGASPSAFHDLASSLGRQPRNLITAPAHGFVVYDSEALRDFVMRQQRVGSGDRFPDQAGVELLKSPREPAERGEPVLRIRFAAGAEPLEPTKGLFSIAPEPKDPFKDIVI